MTLNATLPMTTMLDLAGQLLPWLMAAALLGLAVGWLLRSVSARELQHRLAHLETELSLREHDLGEARRELERTGAHHELQAPAAVAPPAPGAGALPAKPDDLKRIHGVGPVLEKKLHGLGVHAFRQVALWTDADIDSFDHQLQNFRGRIRRENWVRSATEEHFKTHGEWLAAGVPAHPADATVPD